MKDPACAREQVCERVPDLDRISRPDGGPAPFSALFKGADPFRALLDLSGEALILVRLPSGRLVDANTAASRLLGWSREELLERSLPDFFPSAEAGKSCLILSGGSAEASRKVFRTVLRGRGGEEIPVEMAFECVMAAGVPYAAISARDITESLRAEQALKRERDKAQNYFEVAGVILIVITADGKVSLINRKGCEVLGYREEEEIIGTDWFETFLPKWSRDSVRTAFDMLMRGEIEPAEYFENPVLTRSGEEKIIAWHNTVLRDEAGRVIGALSSGQDITERKKTEEELWRHRERLEELVQQRTLDLRHSEEKYRTLVENVPLAVYRITPDGEILFLNRFVKEVFGFTPAQIYRDPRIWSERVYEEDRAEVEALRAKSLASGTEMIVEYRVMHKDGHIVQVAEHAIPFHADGRVSSVDGIILDITAMKEIQEKLMQAEEIKTLSEVSARLAHEIRNPLASAGGFARRLLASMEPTNPDREKMEIIVNEVARLETILRMILAYLEPLELEVAPADPNQVVEEALKGLEPEARRRNVKWDLRLSRDLPPVSMDRSKMERVFQTLFKKALSQVREGGSLSISTLAEQNFFRFELAYPVQEMPSDDVEHFFYPFATSLLKENLDLPRVEILVHKHGGVVEVRLRRPGELAIHISLPLTPSG